MRQIRGERQVPIRWRLGPPAGSRGTLYQFVRDYLSKQGGTCLRGDLRGAIESNPAASEKMAGGQNFGRLLVNMRHSGEIELFGDEVQATPRALRRATKRSYPNATGEH